MDNYYLLSMDVEKEIENFNLFGQFFYGRCTFKQVSERNLYMRFLGEKKEETRAEISIRFKENIKDTCSIVDVENKENHLSDSNINHYIDIDELIIENIYYLFLSDIIIHAKVAGNKSYDSKLIFLNNIESLEIRNK